MICVGDVMVDVLARLPGPLATGSDTPAPVVLLGGGSAANTAAWLAASGIAAVFAGRVGDDALGRAAVERLQATGVTLAVEVDAVLPTGTCIVLVDPDGERTMIPSAGANVLPAVLPPLSADDHVHLSGYVLFRSGGTAYALEAARAAGCAVSVDAASAAPLRDFGADRFLAAMSPALLFANADEAEVLCGSSDAGTAARLLGARCGEAIVKDGARGAAWSDGREVVTAAATPLEVVDSTGAGDAFAAGVLAARIRGADVHSALRAGNELAGSAIRVVGGRPA